VVTDFSLNDAYALACMLQSPDVSFEDLALSPDMVTVGEDEMLMPKMEQIRDFIETSFIQ
jgi:hypothetical protein